MPLSDDASAIAASNLVLAHVGRSAPEEGTIERSEVSRSEIEKLYSHYLDVVRDHVSDHDEMPPYA